MMMMRENIKNMKILKFQLNQNKMINNQLKNLSNLKNLFKNIIIRLRKINKILKKNNLMMKCNKTLSFKINNLMIKIITNTIMSKSQEALQQIMKDIINKLHHQINKFQKINLISILKMRLVILKLK